MIENAISHHPAVRQCSVVGCVAKDHAQAACPLCSWCWTLLPLTKSVRSCGSCGSSVWRNCRSMLQPVAYKFISEMPLTPVGKIDYRKLEEEISPRDY